MKTDKNYLDYHCNQTWSPTLYPVWAFLWPHIVLCVCLSQHVCLLLISVIRMNSSCDHSTSLSDGGEFVSSSSHHSRGGHGFIRWPWREGNVSWRQHCLIRGHSVSCWSPNKTGGGGPWSGAMGGSCSTCKENGLPRIIWKYRTNDGQSS